MSETTPTPNSVPSAWMPETLHPTFPLVGMVHLPPLPGAPNWTGSMDAVVERVMADAEALERAGFDALLVENFGDRPFHPEEVPPETISALTVAVDHLRRAATVPVGVNVLRNDARAALGIAAATGASFIRVNVHVGVMHTDQGTLQGEAHRTLRLREALGARTGILADVLVKHATPPAGLTPEEAARDAFHRGMADVLLVSGTGTGSAPEEDLPTRVREAVPEAPVWLASGLTPENAPRLAPEAHGAIVGSAVQREGRAGAGVDPERAAALVDALRARRGE